jgi:hypothetical protein
LAFSLTGLPLTVCVTIHETAPGEHGGGVLHPNPTQGGGGGGVHPLPVQFGGGGVVVATNPVPVPLSPTPL